MTEQYRDSQTERKPEREPELERIREAGRERRAEQLERRAERSHEISKEDAKREAIEAAREKESTKREHVNEKSLERHRDHVTSKTERKAAYASIMKDVRSQMPAPSRAFSNVIHNPAVEKASEFIGSTVARPNAILAGSVSAFILVLGIYLIAHFFGYPLSGFETIGAFIAGWIVGIIYDFFRVMITGKTQ